MQETLTIRAQTIDEYIEREAAIRALQRNELNIS